MGKQGYGERMKEKITSYEVIKKTSGFALLSFFLSLFNFFLLLSCWTCPDWLFILTPILIIFFGIISLRDIKRKKFRGKIFAVVGIIFGILELALVLFSLLSYYEII